MTILAINKVSGRLKNKGFKNPIAPCSTRCSTLKDKMKKSYFSNQTVYWIIIAIIGGLMIWNLYVTLTMGKLIGLLPITIQAAVLGLIFTKNQYAKIVVKIWAIIFLVIASGLQFVGRLLQDLADNFANAIALHYITTGFTVLVGIMIVVFVNRTVEVIEIEK